LRAWRRRSRYDEGPHPPFELAIDRSDVVEVRSPISVGVLAVGYPGVYTSAWWYLSRKDLAAIERVQLDTRAARPAWPSLLAASLGAIVIVPPVVSAFRGSKLLLAEQRRAGLEVRYRPWLNTVPLALSMIVPALLFVDFSLRLIGVLSFVEPRYL